MFRLIFFLVASLERTSLRIEMVEMLSDLKWPSPLLKLQISERKHVGFQELNFVMLKRQIYRNNKYNKLLKKL